MKKLSLITALTFLSFAIIVVATFAAIAISEAFSSVYY